MATNAMPGLRRLQPSGERKAVIPRRHRKRVKRPNAAIGRLDFYTLSAFWTLAIEEAKWMAVQSPIAPACVALRLTGQPTRVAIKGLVVGGQPVGIAHCETTRSPASELTSPDIDKDLLNLS
jgi:hypothetical protein